MGYNKKYTLVVKNYPVSTEVAEEVRARIQDYIGRYNPPAWNERTWSECDDAMLKMSREFPDIHFKLFGEGEETSDIWYHHYVNGKIQCCEVVTMYRTFDLEQLGQIPL
jgi:hypothetical protein